MDLPLGDLPEVLAAGGHLLLTRHFNRPSNLNAQQEVRLFIRPAAMIGGVWLNSARLAIGAEEAAGASLSIGGLLQRYNRLDILIAAAPWLTEADVRLVIDEPAGQPGASAS